MYMYMYTYILCLALMYIRDFLTCQTHILPHTCMYIHVVQAVLAAIIWVALYGMFSQVRDIWKYFKLSIWDMVRCTTVYDHVFYHPPPSSQ